MCGIAGYIGFEYIDANKKQHILNKMLTRIRHRGPDESGLFLSAKANFGSVRLSIIDLANGQQPLCNENGDLWITYNGEVFNYIELREHLIQKGHVFKTSCDTEVVLHLYEEYGKESLSMLNGQFAFAIWNIKKEELFLARDRVGIRPLFYSRHKNNLIFFFFFKSIFEFPGVERELSAHSMKQILTFWTTISPDTAFMGIKELPPGHYAFYKNGALEIEPYWQLQYVNSDNQFSGSFEEAKEKLDSLFSDSINLRMRSDVPVAAYLSGGLDSSVTTSYIKKYFPQSLHTFSIGFEDENYDETVYQKEVSEYFQTQHHSVKFRNEDVGNLLEKVIWHSEIPLLRAGPIPMFKLSELVRENNIKVVVTGEGADEALGGYNIFKEAIIREFWSRYPDSKIRPLLLKKLYPYLPHIKNANSSLLRMFFGFQLSQKNSPVYSHMLRWKNSGNIINVLSGDVRSDISNYNPVDEYIRNVESKISNDLSVLKKAQYIESTVFMSGYLLSSQGDRVAMGNSVEGRYPFLDNRILEFCATLPDDYKIKGLNEKYLLKELMKDRLPNSVLNRPKQAYRAPISEALLYSHLDMVQDLTGGTSINKVGLFDDSKVHQLIKKMIATDNANEVDSMTLMAVLSSHILHNQYVSEFKYLNDSQERESVIRYKQLL